MAEQPVDRRTALKTFGTAAAVATVAPAGSAAAGRRDSSPAESGRRDSSPAESDKSMSGTEATGFYGGTVDRIVDGEHVVILIEAGGSVIDQQVVPSQEYPTLNEGDSVYLLLIFGHVVAIWKVPGG